ncbi:beta-lactamase domain protein [Chloroherpeton thalassium ATCC 35110]|uniref:Beta-lactamase domain protein n=1 Tax=Chloroherpeton thalassium (strain ATCC 35110 / GB-78) TaxID=517418 RepID=B3QVX8_CHLT3|nr:MBL fold metallo-hydrolase [Chloroherpeton thalassium]ACF14632.1 beta-lactamase domain protein [Chloroherpeton thalassium ATCC 35110]
MANKEYRRAKNVAGSFFVDCTCIDCDTCRWMAPEIFHRNAGQSAIFHQPTNDIEETHALQALFSCPTSSIGTTQKSAPVTDVLASFPILIDDNVLHCGFHSEKSYGAASYFIHRPEGNILIDSPRFALPLVKKFEELGGIRYLYFTHQDDVADHEKFHKHFGAKRIIHEADLTAHVGAAEIVIKETIPYELDSDLLIIPVPGHTKGHTVLLYREKFLFSGDHLAYSPKLEHLYAFKSVCWYFWPAQIESMEKLLFNYSFEWVLPGHGRRFHATKEEMKCQLEKCIDWMKKAP